MIRTNRSIIVLCICLPLIFGASIYLILSPDTYLAIWGWKVIGVSSPFGNIDIQKLPWWLKFVRFYLCDFLWAFALVHSIILIMGEKQFVVALFISLCFCLSCELLQLIKSIPGTFDGFDLIVESSACLAALSIHLLRRKKHEKDY